MQGSHVGLRAWGIAQLIGVESSGKGKGAACTLTVRRFYRPEDIHEDKAYEAPSFHAVSWDGDPAWRAGRGSCVETA